MPNQTKEPPRLSPTLERFVLRWGELGTTWGINRATAQVYALLYLSPEPLTAEAIGNTLSLARSTVSVALRELQNWHLLNASSVLGDRRDYFTTHEDVAELFRAIVRERKRREFDPLVEILRESTNAEAVDPRTAHRIEDMLAFLETSAALHDVVDQLPSDVLLNVARQLTQMPPAKLLTLARATDRLSDLLAVMLK